MLFRSNNPKHTSQLATHWFEDHDIILLPWPSSSPDMNIIKHVWDESDCYVCCCNPLPCNVDKLWAALEEWYWFDSGIHIELVGSGMGSVGAGLAVLAGVEVSVVPEVVTEVHREANLSEMSLASAQIGLLGWKGRDAWMMT